MNYQLDDLDIQISNLANSIFFKLSKKIIEDARNIFIAQIDNTKLEQFVKKGLGEKTNRYKSVDELCEAFKNI